MASKRMTTAAAKLNKAALATGSLSALSLLSFGAEASIIYHDTSIGPVSAHNPASFTTWDVDGNGSAEFDLSGFERNGGLGYIHLYTIDLNGRGVVQGSAATWVNTFNNLPLNFAVGPTLASGYRFAETNSSSRRVANRGQVAFSASGFSSGVPGYFGFKFTDGTNLFYGWAELLIDAPNDAYTINRWAYNNTPDGVINVGQTVPEPSTLSLALIGAGAGGVRAWRKRKQSQALAA